MTASSAERENLSVELERELMGQIRNAAAGRAISVPDFVVEVLRQAVIVDIRNDTSSVEWARLSARSFARDWDSDEDEVYDRLP